MTYSKLAEGTKPLAFYRRPKDGAMLRRYSARGRPVDLFIVHHGAGSEAALFASLLNTSRTLSCNYAMGEQGELYGVVSEDLKANTSSSVADYRAVTIEVANIGGEKGAGNPLSWEVSEASFDKLARLIADVATRHGFPIDRDRVIGHREVLPRFGDGIATRCPGEWLWPRMDALVERAKKYQAEGNPAAAPTEEDDDMGFDWKDRHLLQLTAESAGRVERAVVGQSADLDELQASIADVKRAVEAETPPTPGAA